MTAIEIEFPAELHVFLGFIGEYEFGKRHALEQKKLNTVQCTPPIAGYGREIADEIS